MLTYRDGEVSLDDIAFVVKRLPPSDDLPDAGPEGQLSGFWFELRDQHGEVLYRQIEGNPIIDAWIEPIEAREPERSKFRRIAAVPNEKAFMLLIPDHVDGDHVLLFSSPLEEPGIARPAEPLWRIGLPRDED